MKNRFLLWVGVLVGLAVVLAVFQSRPDPSAEPSQFKGMELNKAMPQPMASPPVVK
jgi:hypothetical protein